MIEQSSRKIGCILAVALLVLSASLAPLPPTALAASTTTGVIVPLYTYPGSTWTTVINAKNAHPNVPIVVIMDPADGPGSSQDSNYVTGVRNMQSAGIIVIGYVDTLYGGISTSTVKSQIDKYKNWYNVNGIFLDEMANWAGLESYYSSLNSYVKSSGMTFTVGNPGTDTIPSYIGTVDNMLIYESAGLPTISSLTGWYTSYDKSNFGIIPFGVSSLDTSYVKSASNYVGYMYITNDNLPNPWDSLPPYFGTLVATLDTAPVDNPPTISVIQSPLVPNSTQIVTFTATATDDIGLSSIQLFVDGSSKGSCTVTGISASCAKTAGPYAAGTSHSFYATATDTKPQTSQSTTGTFIVTDIAPTPPGPPTSLTATAVSTTQINLAWTAPSGTVTGYKIERATGSGSFSTIVANTGSTATLYSNTGLTAGTQYNYRVSAINSAGTSGPSNTASATTLATTGTASLAISTVDVNNQPLNGFYIETIQDNTAGTLVATGLYSPQTITGIVGHSYGVTVDDYGSYYVQSANIGTFTRDNVAQSGTTTFTLQGNTNLIFTMTTSLLTPPNAPTSLTATAVSTTQINLAWTAPSGTVTGYKIERATGSGSFSTIVANTGTTSTTYSNTGLAASTVYNYRLSAINSAGTSGPSNTASATTFSSQVSLTINSVDLLGTTINGLWTEISIGANIVASGYTPFSYTATSGSQYTVCMANWQNYVFDHWDGGSTNSCRTITPTQNTALTAYYKVQVLLTVESVNLKGHRITGLWTTIQSGGTTVATGYTTLYYTANSGTQYTVCMADYQNYVFDHWDNGSTDRCRAVTPTQDTALTAYYKT